MIITHNTEVLELTDDQVRQGPAKGTEPELRKAWRKAQKARFARKASGRVVYAHPGFDKEGRRIKGIPAVFDQALNNGRGGYAPMWGEA